MDWKRTDKDGFPPEGKPVLVKDEAGWIRSALASYHDVEGCAGYLWEAYSCGPINDPSSYEMDDDYDYPYWCDCLETPIHELNY